MRCKHHKALVRGLRTIYGAPTRDAAEEALEVFAGQWDSIAPLISKHWRANWTNLTTFFDYPPAIRIAIYTTNAIESIDAQLRKVTKKHGAFPTSDSVRKVMYLAL